MCAWAAGSALIAHATRPVPLGLPPWLCTLTPPTPCSLTLALLSAARPQGMSLSERRRNESTDGTDAGYWWARIPPVMHRDGIVRSVPQLMRQTDVTRLYQQKLQASEAQPYPRLFSAPYPSSVYWTPPHRPAAGRGLTARGPRPLLMLYVGEFDHGDVAVRQRISAQCSRAGPPVCGAITTEKMDMKTLLDVAIALKVVSYMHSHTHTHRTPSSTRRRSHTD